MTKPTNTPPSKLEANRRWKRLNRERHLAAQREYNKRRVATPEARAKKIAQSREGRKRNSEKYKAYDKSRDPVKLRARARIRNRIYLGLLERQPCEVCGDVRSHAHHKDYSKPLDVRWLCPKHHKEVHLLEVS